MKKPYGLVCIAATSLFLSVGTSYAEETSEVSIGLTYIGSDSIYANVPFKSAVMPSISYKSDTLNLSFQQGATCKLLNEAALDISAAIIPRYSPQKNIDYADLSGMYFDGSLNASYKIFRGLSAELKLGTELTNKFKENFIDLSLSKFIPMARQPVILKAGAKCYSSARANYLYGVNASEAAGQRAEYAPQSVLLPVQ